MLETSKVFNKKELLEQEINDLTKKLNLATAELNKLNELTYNFCESSPGKVIIEVFSNQPNEGKFLEETLTVSFDKEYKTIGFEINNLYDGMSLFIDKEMTVNLIDFLKSQLYKFDK